MDITDHRWRKTIRSGAQSNCVEASHRLTAVRDSKNPSVVLPGDIRRLLDSIQAGHLTR